MGVPQNAFEQTSKVQSELHFKLHFSLLMTHTKVQGMRKKVQKPPALCVVHTKQTLMNLIASTRMNKGSITKNFCICVFKNLFCHHYKNILLYGSVVL